MAPARQPLPADISVNGGPDQRVYFRNTESWSTFRTRVVDVELDAGDNTITFSNDSAYAPDIDLIRIATAVVDGGSPPPPPPSGNLATSASVTCSYSSPWESCAAINSGDDPASSNIPGANQGTRWGTWPETGSHWIELTWNDPVTVNRSEMWCQRLSHCTGSVQHHHLHGGHHYGAAGQPHHPERRRRCGRTGMAGLRLIGRHRMALAYASAMR